MLVILSPAKTLDFESTLPRRKHSVPEFTDAANALADIMRDKDAADLAALMGISDKLARLNVERFRDWRSGEGAGTRQAVLAFMGDVYTGLDARSLDTRDLAWAQKHLRILSGLYGVLRPLDLIRPHRLEMGTRLATPRGRSLYDFWGDEPTAALNAQARTLHTRYLVNLASQEYFGVIRHKALEVEVVTPVFEDYSGGRFRVVSFFAKKARGLMARYIIRTRAKSPQDLLGFDAEGYRYDEAGSGGGALVFRRRQD